VGEEKEKVNRGGNYPFRTKCEVDY